MTPRALVRRWSTRGAAALVGLAMATAMSLVAVAPAQAAGTVILGLSPSPQYGEAVAGGTFTLAVTASVESYSFSYGAGSPASSPPTVTVPLTAGETLASVPQPTDWSCSSVDMVTLICGWTGALPIAAGSTLPVIDVPISVSPTATGTLTTYSRVTATGTPSASQWSQLTVEPGTGPVQDFRAVAGDGEVTLSWTDPTQTAGGEALSGYEVWEGTAPGAEVQVATTARSDGNTYTASGLTDGDTYYFRVVPVDPLETGPVSNEISATPVAVMPATPTITSVASGETSATVTWTYSGPAVTGWQLTPYEDGTALPPFSVPASDTTYTVTGLSPGTSYAFTVAGLDVHGAGPESAMSESVSTSPGPSIETTAIGAATVGQPYTQGLWAVGGTRPYAWAATGLPTGLSIDPSSGTITGTAVSIGSSTVTITLTDAAGVSATARLVLAVRTAPVAGPGAADLSEAWRTQVTATMPATLTEAAAAWDSTASEEVLYGGFSLAGTYLGDTWTYCHNTGWRQADPTTSPGPRIYAAMSDDPADGGVLLYGGMAPGGANTQSTTWLFAHGDWSQIVTATTPPPLASASMAYLPRVGDVLFGGIVGKDAGISNETWVFAHDKWRQVSTSQTPRARYEAAMAYDPDLGGLVLATGNDGSAMADAWLFTGAQWRQLGPAPARYGAVMATDPSGGVVLTGGTDAQGNSADSTWTFSGGNWYETAPGTSPDGYQDSTMVADPATGTDLLFGGAGTAAWLGDQWSWDGAGWSEIVPAIVAPSPRVSASMAYDPQLGEEVLFGGYGANGPLGDTWLYDGATWSQLDPATDPPAISDASMTYVPGLGVLLFGGAEADGTLSATTWLFDGTTWSQVGSSTSPPARRGAAMAWDTATDQVVLYGGDTASGFANDTWVFDLSTEQWSQLTPDTWGGVAGQWAYTGPGNTMPALYEAAATYDPSLGAVLLFGGAESVAGAQAQTWAFSAGAWSQLHPVHSPPARYQASLAYLDGVGDVLFGGAGPMSSVDDDTWVFAAGDWAPVRVADPPPPTSGAVLAPIGSGRLVLFAGSSGTQTTWIYGAADAESAPPVLMVPSTTTTVPSTTTTTTTTAAPSSSTTTTEASPVFTPPPSAPISTTTTTTSPSATANTGPPTTTTLALVQARLAAGPWRVTATGAVIATPGAPTYGSMAGRRLNAPVFGMVATPDRRGYWLVAHDGGVFAFGDAKFCGSLGDRRLKSPIMAMTVTSDGHGYWLLAADGRRYAFGDAK